VGAMDQMTVADLARQVGGRWSIEAGFVMIGVVMFVLLFFVGSSSGRETAAGSSPEGGAERERRPLRLRETARRANAGRPLGATITAAVTSRPAAAAGARSRTASPRR
jgi:hypothetical protein